MIKKECSLYLVKKSEMKLLTVEEAAYIALMDDCEIFNVSESLGMSPEVMEDTTYSNIDT